MWDSAELIFIDKNREYINKSDVYNIYIELAKDDSLSSDQRCKILSSVVYLSEGVGSFIYRKAGLNDMSSVWVLGLKHEKIYEVSLATITTVLSDFKVITDSQFKEAAMNNLIRKGYPLKMAKEISEGATFNI